MCPKDFHLSRISAILRLKLSVVVCETSGHHTPSTSLTSSTSLDLNVLHLGTPLHPEGQTPDGGSPPSWDPDHRTLLGVSGPASTRLMVKEQSIMEPYHTEPVEYHGTSGCKTPWDTCPESGTRHIRNLVDYLKPQPPKQDLPWTHDEPRVESDSWGAAVPCWAK